jgi:asparagine synthase (glutamine-hydrolysing)
MCGITAIIGQNIDVSTINKMTKILTHRGPDGFGIYQKENVAFGHTRLSVVDLSQAANQPMSYEEKYTIIFNGEIYNHNELRAKLEKEGYKFSTRSDTEVILASYAEWREDCVNKFNGMWAFIIHDIEKNTLFISRDRFGEKPLFYFVSEERLYFASEIKAIMAAGIPLFENTKYTSEYKQKGSRDWYHETAFEGVCRFPTASYATVRLDKIKLELKPIRYWSLNVNNSSEDYDENTAIQYARRYYDLFVDSVRLRLDCDVRVGSALSGGLDSSSIVSVVNKILREKSNVELQHTFSCVYAGESTKNCDESKYIDIISASLETNSHRTTPIVNEIPEEFDKMIWAMENPPDNSCMSGWYTFKKVKEMDVKVTLDGQGADEQLAGYVKYITVYLAKVPIKRLLSESLALYFNTKTITPILKGITLNILSKTLSEKTILQQLRKRGNFPSLNLNEVLKNDIETKLVTLLNNADKGTMAFSIESRMPFMDYRIVEFLAMVPACYKIHNGWTKYIARKAFSEHLPKEICWRKDKMGWPIPEKFWFDTGGPLNGWYQKLSNDSRFTTEGLRRVILDKVDKRFFSNK